MEFQSPEHYAYIIDGMRDLGKLLHRIGGEVDGSLDSDGEPGTFRIRIWQEDELGAEAVAYDNGYDQAVGGGSVVVHSK